MSDALCAMRDGLGTLLRPEAVLHPVFASQESQIDAEAAEGATSARRPHCHQTFLLLELRTKRDASPLRCGGGESRSPRRRRSTPALIRVNQLT